MIQLKDVVEIVVKFSAVTMYQWLDNQSFSIHSDKFRVIKAELLSKPLSFGAWLSILRRLSTLILLDVSHEVDSIGLRVASWFGSKNKNNKYNQTKLHKWLSEMVAWRNKEIGHGALRIDNSPLFEGFKETMIELHTLLVDRNPWDGFRLVLINNDNRVEMTGWERPTK